MKKNIKIIIVIVLLILTFCLIYSLIPKHDVFVKAPGLHYQRQQITAVKLQDGNVLVFGSVSGKPNKTAEIYLADKNKYEVLPNEMNRARIGATATLMKDGRVFIVGGEDIYNNENNLSPTAEIYDPKTMKFILVKGIKYNRSYHAASLLKDGRVLITGGWRHEPSYLHGRQLGTKIYDISEAEIYNPKNNKFTVVKMHNGMYDHQQITLNDGKVLITSGSSVKTESIRPPAKVINAELFNPVKNKFTMLEPMNYCHMLGTAILLKDGRVLIAGGYGDYYSNPMKRVEIFNPKTNKFSKTGDMTIPRASHSAVLLDNGNVLVTGGTEAIYRRVLDNAEIFDIKQNKFLILKDKMNKKRERFSFILLDNGNVLIPDYDFSEIYLK